MQKRFSSKNILLQYHYYWQLNSDEKNKASQTADEILNLDEELKELYDQYIQFKTKGTVDLKKL